MLFQKKVIAIKISNQKVALILPVYGGDELSYFKQAFKSIAQQTHQNIQIFMPIDGPIKSDLEEYIHQLHLDSKAEVLWHKKNRGLPFVLNSTIKEVTDANYSLVARMDADDISYPDRIAKQLQYMNSHPDVDLVGTAMEKIDAEGKSFGQITYPTDHEGCLKLFKKRSPIAHGTALFRSSFFEKAGDYPTNTPLAEDLHYWFNGFMAGCRFGNLDETLYSYRVTDSLLERRGGFRRANMLLSRRFHFYSNLKYGADAYMFALMRWGVEASPLAIKKAIYNIFQK